MGSRKARKDRVDDPTNGATTMTKNARLFDEFSACGHSIFADYARLLLKCKHWDGVVDDETAEKIEKFSDRLANQVAKKVEALPPEKRATAAAGLALGILVGFELTGTDEPRM